MRSDGTAWWPASGRAGAWWRSPPQPEPIGAFATATSVYGVVDAAGSFWEWTSSLFEPHVQASGFRVSRGGGWANPVTYARSASRYSAHAGSRLVNIGFRPARSVTA